MNNDNDTLLKTITLTIHEIHYSIHGYTLKGTPPPYPNTNGENT